MKCKSCNQSLAPQMVYCPSCGARTAPPVLVDETPVRRAATQAIWHSEVAELWGAQILILSVIAGLHFSSWWIFAVVLLAIPALSLVPYVGPAVMMGMSLGIGWASFQVGAWFSDDAAWVIGGLAFLISLMINVIGIRWLRDVD